MRRLLRRNPTPLILSLVLAIAASCGAPPPPASDTSEAWDLTNNPRRFGVYAGVPYRQIPTSGRLTNLPWSDDYWPTFQGGISHRWQTSRNSSNYRDYLYEIPTRDQVARLTEREIALLSPAEKLDIALGRNHLPLTRGERSNMLRSVRNGMIPAWFGLCHGWAVASYKEPEPGAVAVTRAPDGRRVTFYSSDMKALLTKAYTTANLRTRFLGNRCYEDNLVLDADGRVGSLSCRDTNPGAFHLVVADMISNRREPFIAEIEEKSEVWNQPVIGYSFVYRNLRPLTTADPYYRHRAPGTTQLVDVDMRLEYVVETSPRRTPIRPVVRSRVYRYSLELNDRGQILGGEWISRTRPDFLWVVDQRPSGWSGLINVDFVRQLSDQSRRRSPEPTPDLDPFDPPAPDNDPGDPIWDDDDEPVLDDPVVNEPRVPSPRRNLSVIPPEPVLELRRVDLEHYGAQTAQAHVSAVIEAPGNYVVRTLAVTPQGPIVRHSLSVSGGESFSFQAPFTPGRTSELIFELWDRRGRLLSAIRHPI